MKFLRLAWLTISTLMCIVGFIVTTTLVLAVLCTMIGFIGPPLYFFLVALLLVIFIVTISSRPTMPRKR